MNNQTTKLTDTELNAVSGGSARKPRTIEAPPATKPGVNSAHVGPSGV